MKQHAHISEGYLPYLIGMWRLHQRKSSTACSRPTCMQQHGCERKPENQHSFVAWLNRAKVCPDCLAVDHPATQPQNGGMLSVIGIAWYWNLYLKAGLLC